MELTFGFVVLNVVGIQLLSVHEFIDALNGNARLHIAMGDNEINEGTKAASQLLFKHHHEQVAKHVSTANGINSHQLYA